MFGNELYTYPEDDPHFVEADSVLFDNGERAIVQWDNKVFEGEVKEESRTRRFLLAQDEGGSNDGNWLRIGWTKHSGGNDNQLETIPPGGDLEPVRVR